MFPDETGILGLKRRTLNDHHRWIEAKRNVEVGVIVLAQIGYEDSGDFKTRPAIVVGRDGSGVVVVPCFSSDRAQRYGALEVIDLQSAGLTRRTYAGRRRVTVERTAVLAVLGRIGEVDAALLGTWAVAA